ncbi:MAG: selenocysteine-specific translation elongation factor, partial [Pseudomonadota bacterium]
MIVTLAGHVDHGKTSLVRTLTGVDTDRLEQEKERGLTIDLGFAYIDEGRIGFVDVPGHHRFIHNMVAGVASHQYALMVIAADDGPMPQSKEHLDILSLVGIQQGCIALTKTDRVDPARLDAVQQEIQQLTQGTFLDQAPVFTTSTEIQDSTAPLLAHLQAQADHLSQQADSAPFRLAIDRRFVVHGAGLVITGTVHTGSVTENATLVHFPSGREVRVRSIRAQDQEVKQAGPGDRCALNITGINLEDVERGHWLCAEQTPNFVELTVNLQVLPDFPRPLRHWTPVHIYHATSHTTGKVALLDSNRLQPGEEALVDLICDEPLAARLGDHLVLRDFGLDLTLGGGAVVHTQTTVTPRRRAETRRAELNGYNQADSHSSLQELLQLGPVELAHFRDVWQVSDNQLAELLRDVDAKQVNNQLILTTTWQTLRDQALATLKTHQASNPSSTGMR